jgi:NADH-quinone oxidoreductase subunit M
MTHLPLLSILTFLPTVAALLIFALPQRQARWTALVTTLLGLFLTHVLWHHFNSGSGLIQYEEVHLWIPALSVQYRVGIDGLGLLMLLLTAIVTPIGIFASWRINKNPRLYFALVLLLQTCLFGTFTALNFIHWFLYWELGLIPAFFLISLWGGPKARAAATQFLVYTMVGSITLLLAFLAIFQGTGTFDFTVLAHLAASHALMPSVLAHLSFPHAALVLFFAAFLGFAVKVPLIPFHTWLPTTYAEAPTGTTILLTGAMSKMGLYGFLRILLPLFAPQIFETRTTLLWLAVATIVLSSFAALAQQDLKRIFAYSSINHLGYCLLAIFALAIPAGGDTTDQAAALAGVFLQIFNHALTAATVFFCIAILEQRSGGLRGLSDFGGLRKPAPVFAGLMGIALFSSLGLPGLNGFPGEFLIFKGSFPLATWATSLSVIGLMITAVFILGVIQKVFSGPVNPAFAAMPDLTLRERLALAGPIALMFLLGLYPQFILGVVNQTAVHILQTARFF